MKEQIDELVKRLQEKEYGYTGHDGSNNTTTVLSRFGSSNEVTALRQVVAEWLHYYYQPCAVELEMLKAKLNIYEEIVKKSNFAPMITEPPKD